MSIYILLLLVSLVLYWLAPNQYDLPIIVASCFVFLIGSFNILRDDYKQKDYFSFNTIFLLSFFLVTYCFPLFVYNTEAISTVVLSNYVNFDYITKGSAISSVAICCYFAGYQYVVKKQGSILFENNQIRLFNKNRLRLFLIISFITVCVSIVQFITKNGINVIAFTDNPFFYELFKAVLAISLISNTQNNTCEKTFRSFLKNNKLELILSGVIAVFMMYFGDRGLPITIGLLWMTAYSFYYSKIKLRHLILAIVVGSAFLFVIRETRTTSSSLKDSTLSEFASTASQTLSGKEFVTIFADLYGASQELCTGLEVKERYGLFYPAQILIIPFTPIPLAPTILSKLMFNEPWYNVCPTYAMNDYITTSSVVAHFGNHVVVDIFMRWGLIGTIFLFFIFGMVPAIFAEGKYSSVLKGAIFLLLMASSLYIPRSSMFDIIRPITYIFVITLLCTYRSKV